ncbi:MAG: hypothetical protein M3Z05_14455 [Gemmatimonadota bacterium]|nr:hypothetical protein [Gemmatimonadota bacterium]
MTTNRLLRAPAGTAALFALLAMPTTVPSKAPSVDPALYAGLTWRNLGPFRAGRVSAVSGAIGQPGVFYLGLPAGGIWKTTSAGQTWYPVFDAVKEVSSIGAIEVAPSDPNIVYAGTGDMVTGGAINEGNGVYRSSDAGATWRHVGLEGSKQIPSMLVDTNDANIVLVAAQGDIHVKSETRGVFRTTDGGATWTRTLFVNDSVGVQKLARANDQPWVIFATTVRHYTAAVVPGRPTAPPQTADTNAYTGTSLYKSTDGGLTWKEISGGGLPRLNGRTSVAVAMHTLAQRVFLITNTGLYRSDDGGTTWRQMAADDVRIRNGQGGYNCGVYVNSSNPNIVYTISTSSYKSTDGGKTFTGFKGAPGGDDPQQLWIDPTNGSRMLLGLDQGGVVTLDGGATWSSYYNQSTDQIYHLATDNSYPYWVYGTQQDAGAIRTRVRGNLGAITPLDWNPVSGWEWGTVLPDPLDPNTVYSSGSGILKITYPSEQWINVSPQADPAAKLRTTSTQPIVFAPWNKHMLIAGFQQLMATTDSGAHWTQMSPDLTVRSDAPPAPSTAGGFAPPGGAIESISPSTVLNGTIWVGTGNGLVKLTRNSGKTWEDVSIAGLPNPSRAEVNIEASHTNAASAYASIDLHRVGDYTPYFFRTHDFGKTWTKIIGDLPTHQASGSFSRVIRNDTKKVGLLFAGTESGMYVSFDDGDHWQSLMQNLPTTSYRDIAIKDNDLVVATYGRGFWVLDDYSMLRELTPAIAAEPAHLFKSGDAVRTRRNVGADTPFPPEFTHAENPLDGVMIDYWLARSPAGDVTIDVLDGAGALVRHLTSKVATAAPEAARPPHPNFWVAPPFSLPKSAGTNRTHWDLRYDPPPALSHSFEINANAGLTPTSPEGPVALPGTYTLRLTADGRTYTQTAAVRADPRSPASAAALRAQHALQMRLTEAIALSYEARERAGLIRTSLRGVPTGADLADVASRATLLLAQLDTVYGLDGGGRGRGRGAASAPNFSGLNGTFVGQLNAQDLGDMAPTAAALAAFTQSCVDLKTVLASLERITGKDLPSFNTVLTGRGKTALVIDGKPLRVPKC